MNDRNMNICQDAIDGRPPAEIARAYGLSQRRVQQILRERNVRKTSIRPSGYLPMSPITRLHARIGKSVYDKRFERQQRLTEAAEEIGWSAIKLRRVEQGVHDITLLDLQDLVAYLDTTISKLWSEHVER